MSLGPMPPTYERRDVGPRRESPLVRTVFLVVGVAVVVVAAVWAFAASAFRDAFLDEAVEPSTADAVEVGAAFTVGDVSAGAGWSLGENADGDTTLRGLVLTNESDQRAEAEATFMFVDGDRTVASVECSTEVLAPGGSAEPKCVGPDLDFADEVDGVLVVDRLGPL